MHALKWLRGPSWRTAPLPGWSRDGAVMGCGPDVLEDVPLWRVFSNSKNNISLSWLFEMAAASALSAWVRNSVSGLRMAAKRRLLVQRAPTACT